MGTLSAFDRMIFKGHLTGLLPHARFLARQGVLLKDFGMYVEQATGTLHSKFETLRVVSSSDEGYASFTTEKVVVAIFQ